MPKTMTNPWRKLQGDLQKVVRELEADLHACSESVAPVRARLHARWDEPRRLHPTTATFETWRDEYVTQLSVAWVLACVFVRDLDNNALVADVSLAGEGPRLQEAFDAFFREHPMETDREYLQHVFRKVSALPAMDALLGEGPNALWDVDLAPDASALPLVTTAAPSRAMPPTDYWSSGSSGTPRRGSCCASSARRRTADLAETAARPAPTHPPPSTRASWAISARTSRKRRASASPSSRRPTSWRRSSSTARWSPPSPSSAWTRRR